MKLKLFLLNNFLAVAEKALNPVLKSDPVNLAHLKGLENKRLQLICTEPEFNVTADFSAQSIRLFSDPTAPQNPDILLKGDKQQWLEQMQGDDNQMSVEVQGDVQLAAKLHAFMSEATIDFGALVEPLLGKTIAGFFSHGANEVVSTAKTVQASLKRNLADFLKYESDLTVSPEQADHFYNEVDELRNSTDRLEARLTQLKTKFANSH